MKTIVKKTYEELSLEAAKMVIELVEKKPDAVLGFATGTSPIGLYNELIKAYENGLSFRKLKTVNLDEYVGISPANEQSYRYFMNDKLFNHIDVLPSNTHVPNGNASDLAAACAEYTALLESLTIDVQILGIGSDGHIGFNEPGASFDSTTNIVELTESTIRDNSRLFEHIDDVPKRAITMGIKNILAAEKIIMVVSGKNKAQAVFDMVKGEVSEKCPASALQNHKDVTIFLDEDAASML